MPPGGPEAILLEEHDECFKKVNMCLELFSIPKDHTPGDCLAFPTARSIESLCSF